MQAIKLLLLTACILLGAALYGQSKTIEVPDSLARHYYSIEYQKISPNGRYVAFNKMYDRSTDTIMVVDRKNPDHIIFESGGVFANTAKFTTRSNLFMREGKNAQILSLPSLKVRVWKDVSDGFYHTVLKQIVLLQNDTLKILNEEGREVRTVAGVVSIKKDDNLVYYTVRQAGTYRLSEWNGQTTKVLYTSENAYVDIVHRDSLGIFVWDRKEKAGNGELIFKTHNSDVTSPLSVQYPKTIYRAEVAPLADGNYFVQVLIDQPPKNKDAVDVWYGNDPKIQAKFAGDREFKYLLWDPGRNNFSEIDNTVFTQNSYMGNPRYLLSFDPYYKHDYTTKFKSFSLYRYDTQLKKFDFLANAGTMAFTDEKGKFILSYRKEGGWDLYNIETFEHRVILVPDHEMAYFAKDGERILFEGMGSLYQYSLSNGSIKKIRVEEGFRIKLEKTVKLTT